MRIAACLLATGCSFQVPDLGAREACLGALDAMEKKLGECGVAATEPGELQRKRDRCEEALAWQRGSYERCRENLARMTCEELFAGGQCDPESRDQ